MHRVFFSQLGIHKASEFDTIRTTMLISLSAEYLLALSYLEIRVCD